MASERDIKTFIDTCQSCFDQGTKLRQKRSDDKEFQDIAPFNRAIQILATFIENEKN